MSTDIISWCRLMNNNTITGIVANASVAKKQVRQLADLISDQELNHTALVAFYALEKLVSDLKDLNFPNEPEEALSENKLLTEQLGSLNKELLTFKLEVSTLKGVNSDLTTKLVNLQNEYDALGKSHLKLSGDYSAQTDEIKRLRIAVDTKEKQLIALNAKEAELLKQLNLEISRLNLEIKRVNEHSQKELLSAKEKSATRLKVEQEKVQALNVKLHRAEAEIAELSRDLTKMNGAAVGKPFQGKTRGVQFFIHEYKSPMTIHIQKSSRTRQLENANWHFQVMRNNGVSISVGTSQWLYPILPECNDMKDEWNSDISKALHEFMMANAKVSHPKEYKRVLAAKKLPITTSPLFTDEEKKALQKAKLITLFDSISLTYTAFSYHLQANNKKLTDEQCLEIRRKIETIADTIETERAEKSEQSA